MVKRKGKESAGTKSVGELLDMRLAIPDYQRPYKWTKKNVADLLGDIDQAIGHSRRLSQSQDGGAFQYRVGTIILHWDRDRGSYDVVDGQQRIVTLHLLRRYLTRAKGPGGFIPMKLSNRETQANLAANYAFIRDWFRLRRGDEAAVLQALSDIIEVVVITVADTSEAFQLFDSQNSRGRALDPHDLLKAYHLREMGGRLFEMRRAVTKWEAVAPGDMKELFGQYLFPIIKWSDRDRSVPFTAQEIDTFKGVPDSCGYAYAVRARKAMPSFQITGPFAAGDDFFSMVDHYLAMLAYLRGVIREDARFAPLNRILEDRGNRGSVGFRYARTLFECALFHYYDRFRNLDENVVKKLFTWAFMLRVDMENLGFDSVNRYAVGVEGAYTNTCPMFFRIGRARLHTDISSLTIHAVRTPDGAKAGRWDGLYQALKELNGLEEDTYGTAQ